ncbi:MAG: hypothetical protein KQH67_11975 [Bacteroidetes bacterium]|nr:hypothetical protein [Bacteroidota bacterium]
MKLHEIELLIEKFYNGETSLAEEEILKDYLNRETVPEQFIAVKQYFHLLQDEKELELDDAFDEKILRSLEKDELQTNSFKIWTYRLSGVAAAILLLIMVWFGTDLLQPREVYGTISDPSLAFLETRKAMDEVSKKLNKGLQPAETTVQKIDKNVKRAGELKKMNQALEKTKGLRKIDQASDLLKSISKVYVSYGDS